ncbi:MAG: Nif3-like dinuclear metal center hexameric protein [Planctomycetota bacterium]
MPKYTHSVARDTLVAFLDKTLNISAIKDESRNGLQVEGSDRVTRVAVAVDACMEIYRRAAAQRCDMLIVHHGIIWDGIRAVRGPVRRQLAYLLKAELNLYAAHLPLDLHAEYGNNIRLARLLGLKKPELFGEYHGLRIGYKGVIPGGTTAAAIARKLKTACGGEPRVIAAGPGRVRTVGIVSGGGASNLNDAIAEGIDCFVTGEPAHWNYHAAREAGINVVYGGHYETETVGVQALAGLIRKRYGLPCVMLDLPTPI